MTTTLILLMTTAVPSGPPTAEWAHFLRVARNPVAELRFMRRHDDDHEAGTLNPGWGVGWPREVTFGGEPFGPAVQRPHPGLPDPARNRLRLSWSWRMEHWARGADPNARIGWGGQAP
jgi:hypothetical protein